jgi:hypothetical protein
MSEEIKPPEPPLPAPLCFVGGQPVFGHADATLLEYGRQCAEAERRAMEAKLADPHQVRAAILRGVIAMPAGLGDVEAARKEEREKVPLGAIREALSLMGRALRTSGWTEEQIQDERRPILEWLDAIRARSTK